MANTSFTWLILVFHTIPGLLWFFVESVYSSLVLLSPVGLCAQSSLAPAGRIPAFVLEFFLLFLICGISSVSTHMSPPAMTGALWFMWHRLCQDAGIIQHTQLPVADSLEHMLLVIALVRRLFVFLICFLDSYTGCFWLRQPKIFWALSPHFKTPQKAIHKAATSGDSHLWKSIGFCPSDSSFGCRESWLPV